MHKCWCACIIGFVELGYESNMLPGKVTLKHEYVTSTVASMYVKLVLPPPKAEAAKSFWHVHGGCFPGGGGEISEFKMAVKLDASAEPMRTG